MFEHPIVSPAGGAAILLPADALRLAGAYRDRAHSANRSVRYCGLLAYVTSPSLAGEMIDRAIVHYRPATNAMAAIALIEPT